jgi:glycosyltransferase involved in cell wall biosynthesis
MDDWPTTLKEPGILYFYWKKVINKLFRKLIDKASVLMSICQVMSDEYRKRYGKNFMPFHNTVNVLTWDKRSKTDWDIRGTFRILYAGRIGRGTSQSILTVAQAVEYIGNEGTDIIFELQTKFIPEGMKKKLENLKYTIQGSFLPYEKLPEKFASADLLVLPMDFDKYNLEFIRLSMPTKVPEYLASGTPVLVFASEETALSKYAKSEEWGFVVTENRIENLIDGIKKLYCATELRKQLGMTGKKVVLENHASDRIRKEFKETLLRASNSS